MPFLYYNVLQAVGEFGPWQGPRLAILWLFMITCGCHIGTKVYMSRLSPNKGNEMAILVNLNLNQIHVFFLNLNIRMSILCPYFQFLCVSEFEGCSSFKLMKPPDATSELLRKRNETENLIYLKWLTYVYPRFETYYKTLDHEPKPYDDTVNDEYKVQVELFCEVNIPKIVSLIYQYKLSCNLIIILLSPLENVSGMRPQRPTGRGPAKATNQVISSKFGGSGSPALNRVLILQPPGSGILMIPPWLPPWSPPSA